MSANELDALVVPLLAKGLILGPIEDILKLVSKDFNIPYADLYSRYLGLDIDIISSKLETLTIKKKKPRAPPPPEERCMARVWNGGKGDQCKRRHRESEYCTLHQRQASENKMKYGRIDGTIPDCFNKKQSQKKRKEKVF